MSFCPACGERNPDGLRFCQMCGAKLLGAVRRADADHHIEEENLLARSSHPSAQTSDQDQRLSKLSVYLGVFGLGIPAIITGLVALRKRKAGREKALLGIGLGALGTLVLAVVLITTAVSSFQPTELDVPDTESLLLEEVNSFSRSATRQVDRFEGIAESLDVLHGSLIEAELDEVFLLIDEIRIDLDSLKLIEDEEQLQALRYDIRSRLRSLKGLIRMLK